MDDITAGFIGFGLIGGSIARALKEKNPGCTLIGYNYRKNEPNPSLEAAHAEHVLDEITSDLSVYFPDCDIIFLCAPVLTNIKYLPLLKQYIKPDCILTDVGSVKGSIHDAIKACGLESNFIGGHPMAGSEKTGYFYSNSKLFENAYYIITPTKKTPEFMIHKMTSLVTEIGAIAIQLDAAEHDDITAAISHVPHIIASSLVQLIRENDSPKEQMKLLAAGGFKDITRIASSSPEMWQNICLTNTDSIEKFLQKYIDILSNAKKLIQEKKEEKLYCFFDTAREYRDSVSNSSGGVIKKVYEIYLDIIDETGAIATIATILASNNISIKNIGILHNREFEEGVLRIEFYDEESSFNAVELLQKYRYTIYRRT